MSNFKFKKILMLSVSCFLILGLLTGCGCTKKDKTDDKIDAVKVNSNKNVKKASVIGNLKFENVSVTYDPIFGSDGSTSVITKVTNIGKDDEFVDSFKINFKDKNGDVIMSFTANIIDSIKSGDSREATNYCSIDLSQAYSVDYEILN